MHHRGYFEKSKCNHHSNGDFTEGLIIDYDNASQASGWIKILEIFPIVKRGIEKEYPPTEVTDENGSKYLFSSEECEAITYHWVRQTIGFIEGEYLSEVIDYLKLPLKKQILLIICERDIKLLNEQGCI